MGRAHSQVVTMVRGTRGHLASEWISNKPITVKADVYSYGMLLLDIVGSRRNLYMSLGGAVEEEELVRALKVAFWCIQDEINVRPSMGEVVKMLEGSLHTNAPPMPQTVLELVEEGLERVYKAKESSIVVASSPLTLSLLSCYMLFHNVTKIADLKKQTFVNCWELEQESFFHIFRKIISWQCPRRGFNSYPVFFEVGVRVSEDVRLKCNYGSNFRCIESQSNLRLCRP
ncbi:hypothetical protein RJ641_007620 [Dillenia turbinata]|uniref:Uncharacterized protein n=1 Tax=Dillenia turbinata TaxID=194707 RepID=A0AAN8V956_9MAGN